MEEQLIFSDKILYRLLRHAIAIILYVGMFHFANNNRTLLYLVCYLPSCFLSIYVFSYLLLPFLQRKEYSWFAAGLFSSFIITLLLNYYMSLFFFANWDGDSFTANMVIGLAFFNQINALCVGGVAMGIKGTKNWYLLQKENQAMERQRAINKLELEKVNLYPDFILGTLANIRKEIERNDPESPGHVMMMSDTLSYLLYDGQDSSIALSGELKMIKDFLDLRKMDRSLVSVDLSVTGNQENKYIAPLTLLRLLQEFFQIITPWEKTLGELLIQITIDDSSLFFRLTGVYTDESREQNNQKKAMTSIHTQFKEMNHKSVELKSDDYMYSVSFRLMLITILENQPL